MNGHRHGVCPAAVVLVCLGSILFYSYSARSAAPTAAAAVQEPEGVVFNATAGTYGVHRVPKRSLDEVMKSLLLWQHQVLADDSTSDYSAEDGILSMECSACGLTRPSAIDIATIDLDSITAYEAGAWHIGIRSKDGTDFFGVLRGEVGPEPHDPARTSDDHRIALMALADLYDLAYLTQNPPAQSAAVHAASAKGGKRPPGEAVAPAAPKPDATSLAVLAANGDVEGIRALQHGKGNSREVAQALESAYGTRSRAQILKGDVDDALQTLKLGRQSFGKSAALLDRETHYVVIYEAYDRLRWAVKLNVAELRDYLQKIQTLEPGDTPVIEQMLARTLSNRIADQRAVGRNTIADDLLSSGRELFPVWADQLTQGTPGVLPQAGVEVDTVAAPPDRKLSR